VKLVHLADIHLGYRAYNKVTSQGINVREADVFNSFRRALAKTLEIAPDLVIIAGDLFHTVRPSNLCLLHAFREIAKFRNQTSAPIVILGGNHDSPRSADTGCVLDILTNILGVYVIHTRYDRLDLPQATVFGLCHRALPELSSLAIEPEPSAKANILAVHGTLEGIARNFYDTVTISRTQVMGEAWDYIAFGHYHIHTKLSENAFYAGATEFTSFNIWSEVGKPKGLIEYDLDSRRARFHPVETREIVDIRAIDAQGLSASEVNELINARIEGIKGGLAEKVVRLVVENIPRAVRADLDFAAIRQYRLSALHFDLDLRPPKPGSSSLAGPGDGRQVVPLEEEWRRFAAAREVPGGVDREKLIQVGLDYLAREEQTAT